MSDTSISYEDCRRLDEVFGTNTLSPLHRSNRFPEEWKLEVTSSSGYISNEPDNPSNEEQ